MENSETEQLIQVGTGRMTCSYKLSPSTDAEIRRRARERAVTQDELLAHLLRLDSPGNQEQAQAPLPPQLSAIDEALRKIREQAAALFVSSTGQVQALQDALEQEKARRKELESRCMDSQREVERINEELVKISEERDALISEARSEAEAARKEAHDAQTQSRQTLEILTRSQEQLKALEEKLSQHDSIVMEFSTAKSELEKLKSEYQLLRHQAEKGDDNLRENAASLQKSAQQLTETKQRAEVLTREVSDLKSSLERLKSERDIAVMGARAEEKMAAAEQVTKLLDALRSRDAEIGKLNNQILEMGKMGK